MIKRLLTIAAILVAVSCASQDRTSVPEKNASENKTNLPMNQTTIKLNNGVVIPQFGLGVDTRGDWEHSME